MGETQATLLSIFQASPVEALVVMKNSGVNTMNYRWQYYNGSAWTDMGSSGSDYYNTLSPNEVITLQVASDYPQVQLVGNASGGAFLEFAITRYYNRASGGAVPLVNL